MSRTTASGDGKIIQESINLSLQGSIPTPASAARTTRRKPAAPKIAPDAAASPVTAAPAASAKTNMPTTPAVAAPPAAPTATRPRPVAGIDPSDVEKSRFEADLGKRQPSEAQIRERAYFIWLARGDQPGDSLSDWLAAERELIAAARMASLARLERSW